MVQKESHSDTSPPNSPGPRGDWPEMRGEAVRRTLSAREPENPEEREIALSFSIQVYLYSAFYDTIVAKRSTGN